MILDQDNNYYELLEITPDASPHEIHSAYIRAKTAYKKDSVALYSLMNPTETEDLLEKIEEAYQILSSPEKRRDYDRNHGLLAFDEDRLGLVRPPRNQKIVSIDRVPPMETIENDASVLIPPVTDFSEPVINTVSPPPAPTNRAMAPPTSESMLHQEIAQEAEWKGNFFRKVRETRKISLEEISDYTKLSKTYILAIEEENYEKLPAAVYVRGFVIQIAKFLRLPHDKVAAAYMARYNQTRPNKA